MRTTRLHDGGGGRISTAQRYYGKDRSAQLASTDQLVFTGKSKRTIRVEVVVLPRGAVLDMIYEGMTPLVGSRL
jgi:hypothetical protein